MFCCYLCASKHSEPEFSSSMTPHAFCLHLSTSLLEKYKLCFLRIGDQQHLVPFRLVMNSNLAGTRVSRLMLNRSTPAFFRLGNSRVKFIPFVVTAMVFRLSNFLNSAVGKKGKKELFKLFKV